MAITTKTKQCIEALQRLMLLETADLQRREWAEEQRARLNLWADSLGVFAVSERFSIQTRLQDNAEVSRVILQLLEDLIRNLSQCRRTLQPGGCSPVPGARDDDEEVLSCSSSDSDASPQAIWKHASTAVQNTLSRLVRLSVLLRRETAKESDTRALRYKPLNDDGEPLQPEFESYIDVACQRAFDYNRDAGMGEPSSTGDVAAQEQVSQPYRIPDYLRARLKSTVIKRWRRLCYQLHQQQRSTLSPTPVLAKLDHQLARPSTIPVEPRQETQTPVAALSRALTSASGHNTIMSAATGVPQHVKIDNLDTKALTVGTASTKARASQLSFPNPPRVDAAALEFFCPYCRTLCSIKELQKSYWRVHVLRDFEPYVCVFPDCPVADMTYRTPDLWIRHLKDTHATPEWRCQDCSAKPFHDADEYTEHLRQHDPDTFSDEELSLVANMRSHRKPPCFELCLFCGYLPGGTIDHTSTECQEDLLKHMETAHLQPFALMSIPWNAAADDADSDRQTHVSCSSGVSREMKESMLRDEALEIGEGIDDLDSNLARPFTIITAAFANTTDWAETVETYLMGIHLVEPMETLLDTEKQVAMDLKQKPGLEDFFSIDAIDEIDQRTDLSDMLSVGPTENIIQRADQENLASIETTISNDHSFQYVGRIDTLLISDLSHSVHNDRVRMFFEKVPGFKRLGFWHDGEQPNCIVQFTDVSRALDYKAGRHKAELDYLKAQLDYHEAKIDEVKAELVYHEAEQVSARTGLDRLRNSYYRYSQYKAGLMYHKTAIDRCTVELKHYEDLRHKAELDYREAELAYRTTLEHRSILGHNKALHHTAKLDKRETGGEPAFSVSFVSGERYHWVIAEAIRVAEEYFASDKAEDGGDLLWWLYDEQRSTSGLYEMKTLRTMDVLSAMCIQKGALQEAEELMSTALPVQRWAWGTDSPTTLASMADLLRVRCNLGQQFDGGTNRQILFDELLPQLASQVHLDGDLLIALDLLNEAFDKCGHSKEAQAVASAMEKAGSAPRLQTSIVEEVEPSS